MNLEDKKYFDELADKTLRYTDYEDKDCLAQLEKILLVLLAQLEEKNTLKYIKCFEES